jgi:hypothetical protein
MLHQIYSTLSTIKILKGYFKKIKVKRIYYARAHPKAFCRHQTPSHPPNQVSENNERDLIFKLQNAVQYIACSMVKACFPQK